MPSTGGSFSVITWICPRCKTKIFSNLGCRMVIYRGRKVRICPACVADRANRRDAKRIAQATALAPTD